MKPHVGQFIEFIFSRAYEIIHICTAVVDEVKCDHPYGAIRASTGFEPMTSAIPVGLV